METQASLMKNMSSLSEDILVNSEEDIIKESAIIDVSVSATNTLRNNSKEYEIKIYSGDTEDALENSSECTSSQSASYSTKKCYAYDLNSLMYTFYFFFFKLNI